MNPTKVSFGRNDYETYIKYDPTNCRDSSEAIIYVHGGAFRYGSNEDDTVFLSALAEKTSLTVYSAGYRNIDEARKLIVMVNDIMAVIDEVTQRDSIKTIHVVGASSGAYLAWIVALFLNNQERYSVVSDVKVKSVILISGYLYFGENDPITKYLGLYPSFQYFPEELKDVYRDYSDFSLSNRLLLITGDMDGCKKDMELLYAKVKLSNPSTRLIISSSTQETMADHCFLINNPNSNISLKIFDEISALVNP